MHRQSPIDLKRDRSIPGSRNEKECPDWHWMQYRDDTCKWDDMKNAFSIERHALQIHIPTTDNGEIACQRKDGSRNFPRLDYSKGFPDWWWLQRTDITLPSHHTQEGVQYAAEVTLAHFYSIDHPKNHVRLSRFSVRESKSIILTLFSLFTLSLVTSQSSCKIIPMLNLGHSSIS